MRILIRTLVSLVMFSSLAAAASFEDWVPSDVAFFYQRSIFFSQNSSTAAAPDISFTLVQQPAAATPATCTTCSYTLTQSIGTGNLIVVMALGYTNSVHITGISGQSNVVECGFNKGSSSTGFSDIAYVLSSTSQASPINVTFGGATGGTTNMQFWEYSFTNGPPTMDICGSLTSILGTTSQAGVTPTFSGSGTNSLTFQGCSTASGCTAVSAYTGVNVNTNGQGWAKQLNSATTTPPTWTLSSAGITGRYIVSFEKGTTAPKPVTVTDFGGCTNAVQLTTSCLNTATHPGHDITPWAVTGTVGFTGNNACHTALPTAIRFQDDGSTYSDSSSICADHDQTTTDVISYGFTATPDLITVGAYFTTTLPNNDNSGQQDLADVKFSSGGTKIIPHLIGNGTGLKLRVENTVDSSNTDCSTFGGIVSGTRHWFTWGITAKGTTWRVRAYDATNTASLSQICDVSTGGGTAPTNSTISNIELGHVGVGAAASHMKWSQVKICYDAAWPCLP